MKTVKRWTEKEFNTLRKLHKKGLDSREIGDIMGRSYYSVSKKISLLGLANGKSVVTTPKKVKDIVSVPPIVKGIPRIESMVEKVKAKAKASGYSVIDEETPGETILEKTDKGGKVKDKAKAMTKVARQIARSNGKRITMAMFFVEDF